MNKFSRLSSVLLFLTISAVLVIISRYHYLLFHTFAEGYSVMIAYTMFLIAWNAKEITQDRKLVFIGIAYLFIGILDTFHTISYTGMNIFPSDRYYANQTWIATRLLEAASLLGYTLFIRRRGKRINFNLIVLMYFGITAIILYLIFIAKVFPECFVAGQGQTRFKIIGEYTVILILLFVAYDMYRKRASFSSPDICRMLIASVIITALSEASFTLYTDNYGITNLIGHLLKILSFYILYKAIIETNIKRPYQTIFAELNDSNNQKDRLISILGHDLTNSLSGIHSNLELLTRPGVSFTEEERTQMFELLSASSSNTLNLLQNILNWARSIQGLLEMALEEIHMDDLIEETLGYLKSAIKDKELDVRHTPFGVLVRGDYYMLSAVIRNVISNSIKFTPRGGIIEIRCVRGEKYNELHIKDSGIGMDEETRKSLFLIGSKAKHYGTENEKGSGFGLLMVDEFVKRHNGTIDISSAPGEGTEFVIKLPRQPENS